MAFLSPPDLSQIQKGDLNRLWQQTREPVDLPSSKTSIDDQSLGFVVRLHCFLFAILLQASGASTSTTTTERIRYLSKEPGQSCLEPFIRLVVKSTSEAEVRLLEGRHVVSVHHEEFVTELNSFELKGVAPTDDFIRGQSFGAFLHHMPEHALVALRCAAGLSVATLWRKTQTPSLQSTQQFSQLDRYLDNCQLMMRFCHVRPQVRMMDIKTSSAYKFVTVKGHVVKARPKRLRVVSAEFSCQKCGVSTISHTFIDGRYSTPTKCVSNQCRSKNFSLIRPTARYINVQEVRLQEAQEETTAHAGRTPRQIEVELAHDLVDCCRPGDVVSVAGVIQTVNSALAAGKTGKRALENSTYKLYMQAHSVTTTTDTNRRREQGSRSGSDVLYSQQQLQSITQLAHADHRFFGLIERRAFPFDLLVRSLCPSIIGHDMVKAGLLLGLLGGTPPVTQGADKSNTIRCNSHILVVGDPGMGKSQMLLATSQLAARSVYVGGNTTTTTGLTVTLTKESGGESGIEAGALVLADQGICCIDEFDKMAKVHQDGLLEAMEQQQISIAKAGVVASLPARCSVIAAANPKHGSYSMSKTVAENLNMAAPILSRFDLVFILRDRADKDQDRLVSSNIINQYLGCGGTRPSTQPGLSAHKKPTGHSIDSENRMPMKERLAWVSSFQKQPLPADLVRDYISYAREYCKPKLTQGAAAVLKDYFMNLRYPSNDSHRKDTVPITTRQLEALIRLSQARAKACLREHVIEEDAMDVVELMMESVDQVHTDESGVLDRTRGGAGGRSKRKMKKAFVDELRRLVGDGAECRMDDLRRIAEKVNFSLNEFPSVVEEMRNEGVLIKKTSGLFQVAF